MPVSLRVITNSELKTHRRCTREHHISYELGYRSALEAADALRFGTLIHTALEAWWRTVNPYVFMSTGVEPPRLAMALATLDPAVLDPFELVRATEMLRGYELRWGAEPWEVIAIESEFRAPLINPATGQASRTFELGGKLDVLALNLMDGRTYIIEHKTSSDDLSPGSLYWQLLQLDTQVSTYYAGTRAMRHDPAGVIYDVLAKPKLRPLQATPIESRKYTKDGRLYAVQRDADETPDEYRVRVVEDIAARPDHYFMRGTVVRLEAEERDAQWDAWQQARAIREGELAQRWPRNPDGCRRYGRMCSYFDVCTGTASLDDTSRFRRVDQVHEELSDMNAQPTGQHLLG